MATQIHSVVNEIKRRIISGQYHPGERLLELQLVDDLGVSRTPIRLAFEELATDGLLERLPKRGFRVKLFSPRNLSDAIDVRGTLEAMAARLGAEKGVDTHRMQVLYSCLNEGTQLLSEAAKDGNVLDARQWMVINSRFHNTLIQAADSEPLKDAIDHISKVPLAAATALIVEGVAPQLEYEFIARAHRDHCDLVTAIEQREGMRAEYIMREHARKTRDNKQLLLASTAVQKLG
jgi:GntR family transcriptional regulator of vanillate catabolism